MEAFDTWLHDLEFAQFKLDVSDRNKHLDESGLRSNVEAVYKTHNGNQIHFVIWDFTLGTEDFSGTIIKNINYGGGDTMDTLAHAGKLTDQFLHGTVMNSGGDGIVVITNDLLNQSITLDMSSA
jgi:hypothetical protein